MIALNIHETKTHLSAILAKVEKDGEMAVICRHGKPIADIVPHARKNRDELHPVMRKIKLDYDPVEPLSAEEWPEELR
jgi:antitoxin (DNA-binding transcriptional repressor) of toxin-antitoxin stability system